MHGMRYHFVSTVHQAGEAIAATVAAALEDGPVVWLLSGGSAMAPEVAAADILKRQNLDLGRLTVTLIDERYGDPGHRDSNWKQLEQTGFNLPGANMVPVLVTGQPAAAVAEKWWHQLEGLLAAGTSIGVLGIGPDYHIAGIKPDSPATRTSDAVCSYDWTDYRRITLTATGLERIGHLLVYATGPTKRPVLERIETSTAMSTTEPSQILKTLEDVTILTDKRKQLA